MSEGEKELENWTQYQLDESLAESLIANNFEKPTNVQQQSLQYLQQHIDLIIAAKTGQGKTLCFGLPILDILIKKVQKFKATIDSDDEEQSSEEEQKEEFKKPREKRVFDSVRSLIISPTRELAIQIKDMIEAVIPVDYQDQIKTVCIVGGMSIQKQQRLLKYMPAIVIATPGRLWELMNEYKDPYLVNGLPMIDILVLDEADRMIADGHFKELKFILNHIYSKRVQFKREALEQQKQKKSEKDYEAQKSTGKVGMEIVKQKLQEGKALNMNSKKNFFLGKNQERSDKMKDIDQSKIVDLGEDDDDLQNILEQENVIVDVDEQDKLLDQEKETQFDEKFNRDYMKMGGIQHIICSATLTINNTGRVTPRQTKINKKKNVQESEMQSTIEALCNTLKFRSKNPKVIDLTEDAQTGKAVGMPDTLVEFASRCKNEEKDLYLYYFLQQKKGESVVIFCNAITATRRLTSLLDFLKIKNCCLHSKMQQKQRLKNLDKFKRGVNAIESSGDAGNDSAILVCTDVAARGLDIPYVSNVVHYQCPFNAEIYIHRCGRTARIGRKGESFALLSPDDSKSFKGICQVLKKQEDQIKMFEINYGSLDKLRPLIEQAKDMEKSIHQKKQDEKAANWIVQNAIDGELPLDEDMKYELYQKLGKKSKLHNDEILSAKELDKFKFDTSIHRKRESKQQQKAIELKKKYEKEVQNQKIKKFSNSSFLTPEAASYLMEAIVSNKTKVDEEVLYAGLHKDRVDKPKFKRKEKYTSRHTRERGAKRRKKGRFG